MATFDAVFVGLTILDIAGRPVVAIPPRGGVAFIEQIRLNPAGTAAGANINAAKLGIRTAAVACLGEDEKADFILASYARLGIDCSLIQRTALKETSATILPIRPNGERPALHCRGASDALFVSEAEFDAVLDCRFLHHGGTGLLAAMDQGQSTRLLQAAKARGVTTSFDLIAPNEETLELLRPLLPSVDYFMPSLEEAAFLSGE
ncbi:TPA: carbohydrate kinase family protein, partial [Klebsiella pneumoniae]